MAGNLDLKNIIEHLANGKLNELCLVCLSQLKENSFESISTVICKEETEYCVADALEAVCQIEFHSDENQYICIECFKAASEAYKFHLLAKQSTKIITQYTEELLSHIQNVETTNEVVELLCIPLSTYIPEKNLFDFNLDNIGKNIEISDNESDNNVVVVVENDKKSYFSLKRDGTLDALSTESDDEMMVIINEKKVRKKRSPMDYISCSKCSIKYRFVAKLKEHMKSVHDIDVFYCKICKIISENEEEYEKHIKTHMKKYQCAVCNVVYKKSTSLMAHMTKHKGHKTCKQIENANICEICGAILEDEARLQQHKADKHVKRYTCYYCGRLYKNGTSFERHIQKHEHYWRKNNAGVQSEQEDKSGEGAARRDRSKRSVCPTCGKDFVDERALLWHQRLHSNDRPFTCETCGRGFVSLNRRNQHALCSHTPPARRCPLCPALFHLRSMVNTHLKKVHLAAHKRRNRSSRRGGVSWRTAPVPVQELSVDLQEHILELQRAGGDSTENIKEESENMLFM